MQEQTKKVYFEPEDLADYYKVYEVHKGGKTSSFNLYHISQLYAMCEEKHLELIEIEKFRSQIEDSIDMNKDDEDFVKYETERLKEVEAAIRDKNTYAIYSPEGRSDELTFISGNTLEELIESISCYPDALDLHSIKYEPRSDRDIYLTVPKDEEEQVKNLGAEFDEDEQKWYIPKNTNLQPFENWLYEERPIEDDAPTMS